ncbi:MAG TPA: DUF2243 domain-containing protein [Mycobacteriales bacterium]|jgi:uncharacterized membrane protein|nr:DUF2243 domain-containing protein [Mycobacteriales bacterium]
MARPEVWPAILTGVGLAMTFDEIVFHQLLAWHHLVQSAPLSSDGVLHLVGTAALVGGVALLILRRPWQPRRVAGWVIAGAGGFNVYDGIVDHKLLRLHQVREGVPDTLPYDLAWLGVSLVVLLAGVLLLQAVPVDPER